MEEWVREAAERMMAPVHVVESLVDPLLPGADADGVGRVLMLMRRRFPPDVAVDLAVCVPGRCEHGWPGVLHLVMRRTGTLA